MKLKLLILPLLLLMFLACEKDDLDQVQEAQFTNIAYLSTSTAAEGQKISVTIEKPYACLKVKEIVESSQGKTKTYDFILPGLAKDQGCFTVIGEETFELTFAPSEAGEYILNFLINGKLFETRTVTVTN